MTINIVLIHEVQGWIDRSNNPFHCLFDVDRFLKSKLYFHVKISQGLNFNLPLY